MPSGDAGKLWWTDLVLGILTGGVANLITLATTGHSIGWNIQESYKSDKVGNREEQESQPNLKGSKNKSLYEQPIPLVLGKHLHTPNWCGYPYTEISGEDGETQYLKLALCCGYSDIAVEKIQMGNIQIASNRDKDGNIIVKGDEEDFQNRIIPIDTTHPLGSPANDITLELIKGNKDSVIYPSKVTDENLKIQLLKAKDQNLVVERPSAMFPSKVQVQFDIPALISYDGNNNPSSASVDFSIEYSLDGGSTFKPIFIEGATRLSRKEKVYTWEKVNYIPSNCEDRSVFGHYYKNKYGGTEYGDTYKHTYYANVDGVLIDSGIFNYDDEEYKIVKIPDSQIVYTSHKYGGDRGDYYYSCYTNEIYKKVGREVDVEDSEYANRITRAKVKEMRFVAEKQFTFDELFSWNEEAQKYESNVVDNVCYLKIQRINEESLSSNTEDKIYLTNVRTWSFDYNETIKQGKIVPQRLMDDTRMGMTTRLVVKLKANDVTAHYYDAFSYIVTSLCPTYLGDGQWDDEHLEESSNPANIIKSVMQKEMLGVNKIIDDRIDLYALGELYEFCKEKGFECNGIVTSQIKLFNLIQKILRTCRSFMVMNGGKYSFFIDKRQEVPVCVLNNHNILKEGLSNTKSFGLKTDGVRVKFINQDIGYQEDTITCYRRGVDPNTQTDLNIKDIEFTYVTKPELAWRLARFELAKTVLRPETWTRKVGTEGNIVSIGNMLTLQDDTLLVGIGDGGSVKKCFYDKKGLVTKFKVDTRIEITDLTKRYGVKVIHSGDVDDVAINTFEIVFEEAGYFDTFTLESAVDGNLLAEDDIVSFGELGKETNDVICLGKTRDSNGNFVLTLLPYSNEIYDMDDSDDSEIPQFQSNITFIENDVINGESPSRDLLNKDDYHNSIEQSKEYTDEAVKTIVVDATSIFKIETNTVILKKKADGEYESDYVIARGIQKTGDISSKEYNGYWKVTMLDVSGKETVIYNGQEPLPYYEYHAPLNASKITFELYNLPTIDPKAILLDTQYVQCVKDGVDSVMVMLKDVFQTFKADQNGNLSDVPLFSTQVLCYKGSDEVDCVIDVKRMREINGNIDGLEYEVNLPNGFSVKALDGNRMASSGRILIPVIVDNALFRFYTNGYKDQYGNLYGVLNVDEGASSVILYWDYQKINILEATSEVILENTPKYIGKISRYEDIPTETLNGDYFLYAGEESEMHNFKVGHFFVYKDGRWFEKSETETKEMDDVFNDMLSIVDKSDGHSPIVSIVDRLVTSEAFIGKLATRIISLQNGGLIKSQNYNGTMQWVDEFYCDEIVDIGDYFIYEQQTYVFTNAQKKTYKKRTLNTIPSLLYNYTQQEFAHCSYEEDKVNGCLIIAEDSTGEIRTIKFDIGDYYKDYFKQGKFFSWDGTLFREMTDTENAYPKVRKVQKADYAGYRLNLDGTQGFAVDTFGRQDIVDGSFKGQLNIPSTFGTLLKSYGGLRGYAKFKWNGSTVVVERKTDNIGEIKRLCRGTYAIECLDFSALFSYAMGFAIDNDFSDTTDQSSKYTWIDSQGKSHVYSSSHQDWGIITMDIKHDMYDSSFKSWLIVKCVHSRKMRNIYGTEIADLFDPTITSDLFLLS